MSEPIIINLDHSPRDERRAKQTKSATSRLGRSIAGRAIDRPNIGVRHQDRHIGDGGGKLGTGRIDIPTGGVRGSKKPTGRRLDFDLDGWADEGTTNPVWVGLPSGRDRPTINLNNQRERPTINLSNRSSDGRKNLRKKIKYGEKISDGEIISRKNGPQWLDGLSNRQIADLLVPNSYETYVDMLADGFGVDKSEAKKYLDTRLKITKPWLELDYSEGATNELKRVLKNTLDESPIFSWAVRKYGAPLYVVMTRNSAKSYNDRDSVKPLYDALKKMYPDAPGDPQFSASTHLDLDLVTLNPLNILDKKSWQTNDKVSDVFNVSKIPTDSDTVIDRSIPATFVHEWAHWYHSGILLSNLEGSESRRRSPRSLINPKDFNFDGKTKIASEYNSDNGNMNLHMGKVSFKDSPDEPRTITSYGHVSKKEAFAEGMLAYMHPNEQMKLKAINGKLKNDIEEILVDDKGVDSWKNSKANIRKEKNAISSGRQERRVTKLSSGAEPKKEEKPSYPRHPSFGPFLGKTEDIFADVKTWSEFKEIYDNLEINYFDYETTGLVTDKFGQSYGNGMPTQFGVTRTKGNKVIARLNIYTNPGEKLGEWSRNNLKNQDGAPLTDEWLSTQMSIAEAHQKLADFAGPNAIFGVQNSVFDNTVLEDALAASGIKWRPAGWIDTKVVADMVIPKWSKENQDAPYGIDKETGEKIPSSSLKALTEFLNIDLGEKHHTADADAEATSELMSKIIDAAIDKKWDTDIFDKSWRDEHEKNKLEKYQKGIISFEEKKNIYVAKNSSDKSTTPKALDKSKFGSGSTPNESIEYRMRHESPDDTNGAPLHNLNNGAIFPEDIYGPNSANLYGGGFPELAKKAVTIFRQLKDKPDSEITVYRAVPTGKKIQEGDWVSILPEYAKIHGDNWLKNDFEIVTKKVKAKDLYNEGNSIFEWGYSPKLSSGSRDREVSVMEKPELSSSTSSVEKNLSILQERAARSEERVTNLQKALDVLERTGEWRGEEFGVTIGTDFSPVDLDVFDSGSPINLSKEDIVKEYGFLGEFKRQVGLKIDASEKEMAFQDYIASSKKIRTEQNTLDIEDLTPEQYEELLEESKSLTNEEFFGAAVHVGQSELEGGVLDPSKTSGGTAQSTGSQAGDTGRLNLMEIDKIKKEKSDAEEMKSTYQALIENFTNGKKTFKPKTAWEANKLNDLFRISTDRNSLETRFVVGEEFDLTPFDSRKDKILEKVNKEIKSSDEKITEVDKLLAAMADGGEYGYVSAYPASAKIATRGYFGRNAGSVVPKNVATHQTQFQASMFGGSGSNAFTEIKDPEMLYRWQANLRGTAYLVTDTKKIIQQFATGEGESQILGKNKPLVGISAPVRGYSPLKKYSESTEWGDVAQALMARAIRLERDGKEVNIENLLAARRSKREIIEKVENRGLSSGKKNPVDSKPAYKGRVWKDRKNELDGPVYSFRSQVVQYPADGPPGISYFKGVVDESTWVDCLLYRDNDGKIIGILNHYPFSTKDPDDPRIAERKGNINIFVDPKRKGEGIATKLVNEATVRYNVDLRKQRYSDEGAKFINKYIRKLPENKDKPKLSSGKTNRAGRRANNSRLSSGSKTNFAKKQLSVKLTESDVEAIGNWNGYLYGDINAYLRDTSVGNSEIAQGMVDTFEKVSVPIPDDLVLFRGLRISPASLKSYEVGDVLQDDGFQSTTYAKRVAAQFNNPRSINDDWTAAVFVVNVKSGTKVMDMGALVDKLDLASDDEDEVLLRNGTKYKVTNIEYNVNKNKWAGIDDTTFEGEKMTIITVDVVE